MMKNAARSLRSAGFAIASLLLALPLWAAGGTAQLTPLVQLQGDEFLCSAISPGTIPFEPSFCSRGTFRQRSVSVFRNGRVIAVSTQQPTVFGEHPAATSTVQEVNVPRGRIQTLSAFLVSQQIADRRGFCNPYSTLGDQLKAFSSAGYEIFWYGTDGGRTTLTLGLQYARACPPEVLAIFDAIAGFGGGGN
jgi:hypothetical protein